ncbi:MAG: hypothetical protein ABIQ86_07125 [Steroidobacteraceae bacterium]
MFSLSVAALLGLAAIAADDNRGRSRTTASLVLPIERSGHYVLEFDNILFDVVPAGGKIVTFSIDGHNMLAHTDPLNFGSTLWSSPQADWNWPPQRAIDSEPYTVSVTGNMITMTSAVTTTVPRISVIKKFTPNLAKHAIDIEYTIRNEDTVVRNLAIWEVTRVAAGGLTFFPIVGAHSGRAGNTLEPSVVRGGYAWLDLASNPPGNKKLYADGGSTFLAHTDGKRLFVKTWADVPASAQAPAHGEVEFYDGDSYVELENQGRYGAVPAGQSISYKVRWLLLNLPAGADRIAQDPELLAAAVALATSAP